MRKISSFFWLSILIVGAVWILRISFVQSGEQDSQVYVAPPIRSSFSFEAIDTMKYSRDPAREKLDDPAFDTVIERQVQDIALAGATHVAIATPYDEEFLPMLERWVAAARKHNLNVWFRGNWSGWEGWFEYPSISREEHLKKTEQFILTHPDLFEDGDAFSSCPECENGGPGDPRQTGDVDGYRQFLIAEYTITQNAFKAIGKSVRPNLFSMNGDVARLVMDKETTRALGGIVTIDHYVETPEQLVRDVEALAKQSGGRIILGEFGAPIPDIHGEMTEAQQAAWIGKTLKLLRHTVHIDGVSYWVGNGGSTALWDDDGVPREAVSTLRKYYYPDAFYGVVTNELGEPLEKVKITYNNEEVFTDENGHFSRVFIAEAPVEATFSLEGYLPKHMQPVDGNKEIRIALVKEHQSFTFQLRKFLSSGLVE